MPGTENSNSGPVLKGSRKETDLGQEEGKETVVTRATRVQGLVGTRCSHPAGHICFVKRTCLHPQVFPALALSSREEEDLVN